MAGRKYDIEVIGQIIKDNNIDKSTKYIAFYEINEGKYMGIDLPVYPWTVAKMSAKSYFNSLFPERLERVKTKSAYQKIQRKSLQEHIDLIINNKIFTEKEYRAFFSSHRSELRGYYSLPWAIFKFSAKTFFDLVYPNRKDFIFQKKAKQTAVSPEQHVQLIRDNKITSARSYRNFYLLHRNELDLLSRPWDRYGMSESDFFAAIRSGCDMHIRGEEWMNLLHESQVAESMTG